MKHIKNLIKNKIARDRGAALMITILFLLVVSTVIMIGSATPALRDLNSSRTLVASKGSYYTSEAGVEDAMYRIKEGKSMSNPEETSLNGGTVSVATEDVSSSQKDITATSDVSSSARKVKASLFVGIGSDFVYGAQVGAGGIEMGVYTEIEGDNGAQGNVFSNGPILGSGALMTSHITGTAVVASGLSQDVQASHTIYNADQEVGHVSAQADVAQSFVPSESLPLQRVSLYMKKVGSPASPNIRIVADNSGKPKTTELTSVLLSSSNVTSSYQWVDITFPTPTDLVEGRTYWILIDASAYPNDYYVVGKDSAEGYANGVAKYSTGWQSYPWTTIAGDLNFKTYLGVGNGLIQYMTIHEDAHADTIDTSNIYGTAYCQSGSNNNKACDTSGAPSDPEAMPVSSADIEQLKADATAGGVITGNCGNLGVSECRIEEGEPLYLGPKKIVGNLSISEDHFTLKLTGILYVTGNVTVSGDSDIECASSLGSNGCAIIADGYISVSNGGGVEGSGQPGSYILLISTKEGCNGAIQSGCATGYSGIYIRGDQDEAVFYTTDSMIYIGDDAKAASVAGYKLKLADDASIDYDFGVTNAFFFSGPGGGWNVRSWKEVQ